MYSNYINETGRDCFQLLMIHFKLSIVHVDMPLEFEIHFLIVGSKASKAGSTILPRSRRSEGGRVNKTIHTIE